MEEIEQIQKDEVVGAKQKLKLRKVPGIFTIARNNKIYVKRRNNQSPELLKEIMKTIKISSDHI